MTNKEQVTKLLEQAQNYGSIFMPVSPDVITALCEIVLRMEEALKAIQTDVIQCNQEPTQFVVSMYAISKVREALRETVSK